MFSLTRSFCLLLLVYGVCGITIHKECMPKSDLAMTWEGSYIEVTFWLPEEAIGVDLKYDDAPLWFQLQFLGTSMPKDYDRIWISPSKGVVERIRNRVNTKTNETYSEPMKAGWNTLIFSANHVIEVNRKAADSNIPLVSTPLDIIIDKIEVTGSNITVNCHHQSMIWQLEGGRALNIPLLKSQQEHRLSIFSNQLTRPMISLPLQDNIQLGWDGSNLADQTVYKKELQSPVPAAAEHIITVSCRAESKTTCDVLVGSDRKNIKTVEVSEFPGYISFRGAPTDKIFVSYYYPSGSNSAHIKKRAELEQEQTTGSDSNSLYVVIVVLVLVVTALTGVIVAALFVFRRKLRKMVKDEIPLRPWEEEKLLNTENPKVLHVLKALETDDIATFRKLTNGKKNLQKYETEAHFLGKQQIVKHFIGLNKNAELKASNDKIKDVLKKLENATRVIFSAAKKGNYRYSSGVKVKLEDYHLPGSIRDDDGSTILHCMAKFTGERPVWCKEDISEFLEREDYFINAADHKGNTVLHVLAENDSPDLALLKDYAKLFISKMADPGIKNKSGKLPEDLAAKNKVKLVKFLKEERERITKLNTDDGPSSFEDLLAAVNKGNIRETQDLLNRGTPLLPLSAEKDPLVEAMRKNERTIFFLLLSGGAPICNRSINDITPLEAAHNTGYLPACYAAILRKAYCDQLKTERVEVSNINGDFSEALQDIIGNHIKSIKESGRECEGIVPKKNRKDIVTYSKKVRELLVAATKHDLFLTCLLLAQKDTYLHPLAGEESPFQKACERQNKDLVEALCRDVGMMPFSHSTRDTSHDKLFQDMYQNDVKTLKNAVQSRYKGKFVQDQLITELQNENAGNEMLTSKDFLYLVASLDLVAILNKIVADVKDFDINQIVEDFSKSTMLHVASMCGSIRVIEYLISKNALLSVETIGKFTAAHLAAIGGHKECFHCIISWMSQKEDGEKHIDHKCQIGLTANDIMEKYEDLCQTCALPLMTHNDALYVKNEEKVSNKTYEILRRKGRELGIDTVAKLIDVAQEKCCKEQEMQEIGEEIKKVTEELPSKGFIKGKLTPNGPLTEKNEVLEISHVDFIYEIDVAETTLQNGDVSQSEVNPTLSASEINSDSRFIEQIKVAITGYTTKEESEIMLSPPFLEIKNKGVNIRWIWKNKSKIKLLTTYIVPVVKADGDQQYFYDSRKQEWVESTHEKDRNEFSSLDGGKKKIWLTCRLLRKLTQSCWWSPTFNTQYYPKPWHTWDIGVEGLSETKLKRFFRRMEQAAKSEETSLIDMYDKIAKELQGEEKDFVQGIQMYLGSLKLQDAAEAADQGEMEVPNNFSKE